jgi:RNA polymerase sigma-70 factor (ECF subfamily)
MLQACSSNVRPTASAPRLLVTVRRERRGKIDSPATAQLNSDQTIAARDLGKDLAVIQQAVAGNHDAQEYLFARHADRLYRTAFSLLHNKEDAQDALQDGLCKAYTGLHSFQGRSSFSTWLTRIVINSALMARRKKSVHPEASLDEILDGPPERLPLGVIDGRPDPERLCAGAEVTTLIEEQVRRLPPLPQTAFRLLATNGLSSTESSETLGIRERAFKSLICRARHKVGVSLQESLEICQTMRALPARIPRNRNDA